MHQTHLSTHDEFMPTHNDLVKLLTKIAMQVANDIREHYDAVVFDEPVDLETHPYGPADENSTAVDGLYVQYRGAAAYIDRHDEDRASCSGDPQITADRYAHDRVLELVEESLGDVVTFVVGEESTEAEWDQAMAGAVGDLLLIIDPIDGSSLLQTTGTNWSVNFILYQITELGLDPKIAVCATQGNEVLTADLVTTTVRYRRRSHARVLADFRETSRPWSVAVVGTAGQARESVAPLFRTDGGWGLPRKFHGGVVDDDPSFDVLTVGGAPVMMNYPLGELCFLVIPVWQTVYDAAPLLALALLNKTSFTRIDTKKTMTAAEVIESFRTFGRPGTPNAKPIPPMLLCRRDIDDSVEGARANLLDELHRCYHNPMTLTATFKRPLRLVRDTKAGN